MKSQPEMPAAERRAVYPPCRGGRGVPVHLVWPDGSVRAEGPAAGGEAQA
jgi:hypothetical protein